MPPWSHGASVTRDPISGEYLLFHIGNGKVAPSTWSPCYNGSEDTADFAAAALAATAPLSSPLPGAGEGDSTFVERAATLEGPWTSFNNNSGVEVIYPAGSWATSMTNPAAFIFPNGTTLLYYRADQCPKTWGALAPACIGVAIADSWEGPYTSLFTEPITHPEGEDPAVCVVSHATERAAQTCSPVTRNHEPFTSNRTASRTRAGTFTCSQTCVALAVLQIRGRAALPARRRAAIANTRSMHKRR